MKEMWTLSEERSASDFIDLLLELLLTLTALVSRPTVALGVRKRTVDSTTLESWEAASTRFVQ